MQSIASRFNLRRRCRPDQHLANCRRYTDYISGPSARAFIEPEQFAAAGITLEYMAYDYPHYPQLHGSFESQVSILDLFLIIGPAAGQSIWET